MPTPRVFTSDGNSSVNLDYGRALMNQKGGWTLSEFQGTLQPIVKPEDQPTPTPAPPAQPASQE